MKVHGWFLFWSSFILLSFLFSASSALIGGCANKCRHEWTSWAFRFRRGLSRWDVCLRVGKWTGDSVRIEKDARRINWNLEVNFLEKCEFLGYVVEKRDRPAIKITYKSSRNYDNPSNLDEKIRFHSNNQNPRKTTKTGIIQPASYKTFQTFERKHTPL